MEVMFSVISFIAGLILGGAFLWFVSRSGKIAAYEQAKAEAAAGTAVLSNQVSERDRRIGELQAELHSAGNEKSAMQDLASAGKARIAELETRLEEERKQTGEKIALLIETKDQLKAEFQNLANQIFDDKSKKFVDQNRTNLDGVLNPLREQLGDFKKKVEDVYDKEARDRTSLLKEIEYLRDLNQRISEDALNLTNALKGEVKTQGNWGEVILERVLEASGLQKGREYDVQVSLKDEEGARYQPDVVVRLPENKDVIVDSKVSLKHYEQYCSARTDEERAQALKLHIKSMRAHIKGLSEKDYENLEGVRSLDFVLMFVPIEAAFLVAVEEERELFSEAFRKNIMVVSPSTLLVTLRTIQNIWRYEYQNQNAQVIADKAGNLYDKFVGFVESLEDVGKHIDRAKDSYTTAHRRLSSGSGNLIGRTQELKKLGVKSKKQLPGALSDKGEMEMPELGIKEE